MALAHFRTGKDQYTITLETKVSADVSVGELVTYTASTTTIAAASTVAAATHMIALGDEAAPGGYVSTDAKNYAPSGKVKASTATKRVVVYPLFNKDDVILD